MIYLGIAGLSTKPIINFSRPLNCQASSKKDPNRKRICQSLFWSMRLRISGNGLKSHQSGVGRGEVFQIGDRYELNILCSTCPWMPPDVVERPIEHHLPPHALRGRTVVGSPIVHLCAGLDHMLRWVAEYIIRYQPAVDLGHPQNCLSLWLQPGHIL